MSRTRGSAPLRFATLFCQSETDVKIALGFVTAFRRSAVGLSAVRLLDHAVDVDRAENRSGALISEDNHTITPW